MQISNFIGKQIFSPVGQSLGVCLGVLATHDLAKLTALSCIDGDEDEFFLPARAVKSIRDVIIATNSRLNLPHGAPVPIGKPVFSHHGEELGFVCDVYLGDNARLVVTRDGTLVEYPLSWVIAGETVIVYPSAEDKPVGKRKTTNTRAKKTAPVPQKPVQQTEIAPKEIPLRDNLHRLDLIGRRVKKTVFDSEGIPLITAGELVSPQTIRKARRNNKLLQLTVNTLTNIE